MNILNITTRNIYEEGGEKTLMLSKDKFLKKFGVNTYFYSFRRNFKSTDVEFFNVISKENTLNLIFNKNIVKKRLLRYLKLYSIDVLVVSGIWFYFFKNELAYIKEKTGIKISLDFQGVVEEIKEYSLVYDNRIISEITYLVFKKLEDGFMEIVDGIEVVSNNAIEYLKQEYKLDYNKSFVVVPCGIKNPLNVQEYEKERDRWRKFFKLNEKDIGVVYAGGIHKWQNLDDVFSLINKVGDFNNVKFFIFTSPSNQEFLKKKYKDYINQNIYFGFLPHEQLEKALCAFDIGILFRNSDTTNYAAFPNKFSEYMNARLTVLLKNKNIGCYPPDKFESVVKIINNEEDFCKAIEELSYKDFKLYNEYINTIVYNNTIKQLIQYYKNLIKL